jgi:hypothetical protein
VEPGLLISAVTVRSPASILFFDISACCSLIGPILILEGVSESTKSARRASEERKIIQLPVPLSERLGRS